MSNTYPAGREPVCPSCRVGRIRTVGATVCYHCKSVAHLARSKGLPLDSIIAARREDANPKVMEKNAWDEWLKTIRATKIPKRRSKKREKILVLPDLHVPFHHKSALAQAVKREADADRLVIMGDVADAFALSRFVKYEIVPYEQEIVELVQVLTDLSKRFPKIHLISGNHDGTRLEKTLRGTLNPDFIQAILLLTDGTLSPVDAVAKRFPNIELSGHQVDRHHIRWFTQIGDALFMHAESFSRVPGSALRRIEEWVTDMERTLKLNPWRIIVQAHTHQLSMIPWSANRLLVECGCLCETHGYQLSARISGRPQRLGYVVMEQERGITDINSVRLVWLDDLVTREG
jgi:predicted phosphodiesterase